jgi:hypothetical protein
MPVTWSFDYLVDYCFFYLVGHLILFLLDLSLDISTCILERVFVYTKHKKTRKTWSCRKDLQTGIDPHF